MYNQDSLFFSMQIMHNMHRHEPPPPELRLENLQAVRVLGKGATGTVFLVQDDSSKDQPFALKVVEKSSSVHSHADRRARHEISVLRRLASTAHPFLPHLIGSSEDQDLICWGIPYCPGGDLNALRRRQCDGVFSPAVIRFYSAEILCALECLHAHGVAYRDLKPENILVQDSGHVTLTDFDLSRDLQPRRTESGSRKSCSDQEEIPVTRFLLSKKKAKSARVSPVSRRNNQNDLPASTNERSNSFVGTEEYMSPEVVRGDGHEFAVDWWALGVLCYEMLYGTTPFRGRNRKETFRKILLVQPEFMGRPDALTDLIKKLLEKDPTRRLGYHGGASEIKGHEFFRGMKWDWLTEVLRPPFLPSPEQTEMTDARIDVREHFRKRKLPPSPLWSPSMDEAAEHSVSLTEF